MKKPFFEKLAQFYVRRKLRRSFCDLQLQGHEHIQIALSSGPVLIAINHVAWWDPLLIFHLSKELGFTGWALMDRANLTQLPFFSWLGALPLDRKRPRQALRDLEAALSVIKAENSALFIFPQGKQVPAHLPLHFERGVALAAKRSGFPVLPIALRYDFGQSPRATVRLCAQPALALQAGEREQEFLQRLEQAVAQGLRDIDTQISNQSCGHSLLFSQPRSELKQRLPAGSRLLSIQSQELQS